MTLLVYLISLLQFLTGADDVSLVFAGDAMQHERQIKAAAVSGGGHDYKACFRHVADYVGSADYAVVNLECPLGGKPYAGYPCFSAPDEFAEALRGAGFDLFLQTFVITPSSNIWSKIRFLRLTVLSKFFNGL